jgi:transposase
MAARWHVLQNLTEAVQRVVQRHYARLREIVQESTESTSVEQTGEAQEPTNATPSKSSAEQLRRARNERRQARCAEVLRLQAQGMSILAIARHLRMHRCSVRQYIRIGVVP